MIASDVVSAAAVGTLGVLIVTHNAPYWAIVVVAFVDATASVFFRAGMSGAFRSVVPLAQLADASSVTQARAAIVRLGAPPVGGALFAVGRAIPFLVDAVSYVFSTRRSSACARASRSSARRTRRRSARSSQKASPSSRTSRSCGRRC